MIPSTLSRAGAAMRAASFTVQASDRRPAAPHGADDGRRDERVVDRQRTRAGS
jgi:hypothetical protein